MLNIDGRKYTRRDSLNDYIAPFVCLMLFFLLVLSFVHTSAIMERIDEIESQYTEVLAQYRLVMLDVQNGKIK